jgi:hypothetical protein
MKKIIIFAALLISVTSWAAEDAEIKVTLERPAQSGVVAGISTLHGWAVAKDGIDRVELFVNGVYSQDIPYGGLRPDVGSSFPTFPDSDNSGFSVLLNYSELAHGANEVLVRAYDSLGNSNAEVAVFNVERFESTFITDPNEVDLTTVKEIRVEDKNTVVMEGVTIEGQAWNVNLKWQTASQGFDINLTESITPPNSGIKPGKWEGPGVCIFVGSGGNTITSVGSTCNQGLAFDSQLDGLSNDIDQCRAEIQCAGTFSITANQFTCYSDDYDKVVIGTFAGNDAAGLGSEAEAGNDDFCLVAWTADSR